MSSKGYRDPNTLQHLYWDKEMSAAEIGDKFGVSHRTILNWMEDFDIPRRPAGGKPKSFVPFQFRNDGYTSWHFRENGGHITIYVHQLLAIAKGESPHKVFSDGESHCHHKNGVKWDNRPENIELVTPQEHADRHPERGSDPEYTDKEMLDWIQTFVAEFGYVPYTSDIDAWPGPHPQTYVNRFGSWTNAVNKAGFKTPNHPTDSNGNLVGREEPHTVQEKD